MKRRKWSIRFEMKDKEHILWFDRKKDRDEVFGYCATYLNKLDDNTLPLVTKDFVVRVCDIVSITKD